MLVSHNMSSSQRDFCKWKTESRSSVLNACISVECDHRHRTCMSRRCTYTSFSEEVTSLLGLLFFASVIDNVKILGL
jgi:hypothetical protein